MNGQYSFPLYQKGHVLIIVLMFSLLLAMLANFVLSAAWLEYKMSHNFSEHLKNARSTQLKLRTVESQLAENFNQELPKGVKPLQFVPDTLHFGEKSGVDYYQVEVEGGASTFAIRN